MIRIKPIRRDPPNSAYWPDGAFPDYCYSPCRRACRASQSITIWHMIWTFIANRDVPWTGHGHPDTHVYVDARDFYMDQYGCVAIGPEGSEVKTLGFTIGFVGQQTGDWLALWQFAHDLLFRLGPEIKEPGTIEVVTSIETITRVLMRAAQLNE